MAYLIGLDIGTSGTKTVLFDERGGVIASKTVEYPLYCDRPQWAEQQPEDWRDACIAGLRAVMHESGVNKEDVAGIGLSGQMHGLVMLDKAGEVLRRSIIWCDQRTGAECAEITRRIGAERLIEITANPALTGFTASKILWVQKHEPEIWEKCAHVLLPKDYIRYCLTGEFAAEVSDASGMQLLDVPARTWSREVLDKLEIDPALLAPVYESTLVTGRITAKIAAETRLAEGTPVVGGAGDQAAGAVGNGIVCPGAVSSTIGSSGVVFAYTDEVQIDPRGRVHTFCHAVPGAWHVMGVTQGAGISLKWFRDNFCGAEKEAAALAGMDPYVLMDKQAARAEPGCGGVVYLPYLMGERTPHLDPDARGVFFGMTAATTRADMLRAVMEGVVFSLNDCLSIIRGMGIPTREIRASGGGGRSPLWRQMQADIFGKPIHTISSPEGPALGVALLAGVGTGVYASVPEACEASIRKVGCEKPNAAAKAAYKPYYALYKNLYKSLRKDFGTVSSLTK
ncbi:MAG: xylulokinase [Clostridia bacterium]|nr:xylulokinase [Clostridia bacterium]